jgi:biotin carboxylase
MKKLLMLGGSLYQTYAIKEARKMGYHVITCDYLPDNPGHQYANEYYNISTTDKEAVLQLAEKLKIDGIVSYASDPAAPVAAFVAEQLNLPTSPYKSVEVLSKKDLFREFLSTHDFNVPKSQGYFSYRQALCDIDNYKFPVMVKPVDSSGSKGVNKLENKSQLKSFSEEALMYSRDKKFLIEEFIEKQGYQISGDMFSVDGKIVFWSFANEFYSNKIKDFVPLGECWPSVLSKETEMKLINDLQRLISLLGMKSNAYNVEAILDKNDRIYIMEVGARSGGSLIPQIIESATGVNMVKYVIKAALGEDCSDLHYTESNGYWSNYMLHSMTDGIFEEFSIDKNFQKDNVVDIVTDVKKGDKVNAFRHSGDALGTMILKYKSFEDMMRIISNIDHYVQIKTSPEDE